MENALSRDKDYKIAKDEKGAYEDLFDSISKVFSVYGDSVKSFNIGQNYLRPDNLTNVVDNLSSMTVEPLLYIDIASAALSHFTMPVEKESIRIQPLSATLLRDGEGRLPLSSSVDTRFFENAGRTLQKIIMNPALSFPSILTSAIRQLLLFGSTAIAVDCKNPTTPIFKVIDFREIFIFKDDSGEVKKIYREYTPRTSKAGNSIEKKTKKVQCFELLDEKDNKIPSEIAIKYTLYNEEGEIEEMLDGEDAFSYWPIAVTSLFDEPGYQYSSSLGQRMQPHVVRLNALKKLFLSASHLQVNPPLQMTRKNIIVANTAQMPKAFHDSSYYEGSMTPSALNDMFTFYLKPGQIIPVQSQEPTFSPIIQSTDLSTFALEIQNEMAALRQHSYIDVFMLTDLSGNASVEEVTEKVSRKISILNPFVSCVSRLLNDIVLRVFFAALSNKKSKKFFETESVLPSGDLLPLDITYENQFTKLPSFLKARGLADLAMRLGQLAQIDPAFVDSVNMNVLVNDLLTLEGYSYLKASEEEIAEKQLQRQQLMQQDERN